MYTGRQGPVPYTQLLQTLPKDTEATELVHTDVALQVIKLSKYIQEVCGQAHSKHHHLKTPPITS